MKAKLQVLIDKIYDGTQNDIDIVDILNEVMTCKSDLKVDFVVVLSEIEKAMKKKDYLLISDILRYEILDICD